MKAFVLTDKDGQIKDRDMLDLYDGYLALGFQVQFFTETELYTNRNLITKDDIFGGHVSICRQIWKNIGVNEPCIPNYPEELKEYFGRFIRCMKLKDFRKILQENENFGKTYFVKPVTNKLFTGFTCVTEQELSRLDCSNNADVYVSSYINFGAEFRAYVYNGKVVDCFRYWGNNWRIQVPHEDIEKMVSLLTVESMFYSLDVGMDNDTGKILLVEVNDGYALGNYGLSPVDYAKMTTDRCRQIVNGIP
jgi:hypothetical protein